MKNFLVKSETAQDILYKYRVLFYILSGLFITLGILLLPFNPEKYIMPLAGVFTRHPHILAGITIIAISLAFFNAKKMLKSEYGKIGKVSVMLILDAIILVMGILSFFSFMPLRVSFYIVAFATALICMFNTFYFGDRNSKFYEVIIENLIPILIITISSMLLVDNKVITVENESNALVLTVSIAIIVLGLYLLFATIVTERVNKYVNRNDMDLEQLKEDLSEIKDDKIPE